MMLGIAAAPTGRELAEARAAERARNAYSSHSLSASRPPLQVHTALTSSGPAATATVSAAAASQQAPPHLSPTTAPLLVDTASAARWRRKGGSLSNINTRQHRTQKHAPLHQRAASAQVVPIASMEEVHGVDVSWLHNPHRDSHHRKHPPSQATPNAKKDAPAPSPIPEQSNARDLATKKVPPPQLSSSASADGKVPSFPNVTPPTPVEPSKDTTHAYSSSPSPSKSPEQKRPGIFSRPSSERAMPEKGSKRSSWMNSLSSKFSSQTTPERPGPTPAQAMRQGPTTPPANGASNESAISESAEPYTPSRPKESSGSFFSSIKRSLSATSQTGGIPKVQGQGGVCARRVLNVDPNRERCNVPAMDSNKLRRVSFCVDVEIAGGPRYHDDEDDEDRKRKKKDVKLKERAEGEALKHPEPLAEEKDQQPEPDRETSAPEGVTSGANGDTTHAPDADGVEEDRDASTRKREKKKQSEAERKERKEKRRRRAEESGAIPVELALAGGPDDAQAGSPASGTPPRATTKGASDLPKTPPMQPQPNAKQDRPTTDPVRIYRRCCQLRESPILKRITEQLMSPNCMLPHEPGIVACLDLTGSRLQLADVVTLGDWLAVVPVKQLKLEDADLSDEGIRCVLAGLLAAKKPEPTKRKSITPRHREAVAPNRHQERSGVVEKVTLKNNPRLTRVGWKHISLFIYMCRSLRALDLSMNQFPDTLPPSAHVTPIKNPNSSWGKGEELDAAESLYLCLSERLGGQKLEELIMSECDLSTAQIRKIVDGVIASGIRRLGLAGNHLDDEAFGYILEYLRTGKCQALDVGSNDLRGKLGMLGEAISTKVIDDVPCWGLCLQGCNLDTASLKPLFAELVKLPSFRFIDLSHNRDLCNDDHGLISLLGRYIGRFPDLKRIHLSDVDMSPKQAISLANILPEAPKLAHVSLLENPQLTALANAKTEADQEEACALYASLMAAVRVSGTLICVDIDVPSQDNSEVVKALAKQVVAYSLRNMEDFAITEATPAGASTANATAALTAQHGGEKSVKDFVYPDVLMHLVGHIDGVPENHDLDDPAPDEDYIVGGTGVVKALQYVLGEKMGGASPRSGASTPKERPDSSAGLFEQAKAKKVSKNLLGSARKIRDRLQPALLKESDGGDEAVYRRLLFLDQTLQSIIERFEEEYPETRLVPPSPTQDAASVRSTLTDQSNLATSVGTQATEFSTAPSDEEEEAFSPGEEDARPPAHRQNSEASLYRAQTLEEGRIHRAGMQLRREVMDSPASTEFRDVPWKRRESDQRFRAFATGVENMSGEEMRGLVDELGWQKAIEQLGGRYVDLRHLQEEDPEAWELFKEAQEKARYNMNRKT